MTVNDMIQDKEKLERFQGRVAELVRKQGYEGNAAIKKAASEIGCELTEEQIGQGVNKLKDMSLSMSDLNQVSGGIIANEASVHDALTLCAD